MSQNCMDKYKSDFTAKFKEIMDKDAHKWKEIQNSFRHLISLQSFGFYFFMAALGMIPVPQYNYDLNFHLILAAIIFVSAAIIDIQVTNTSYQDTIKVTLFPELLKIFGNLQYRSSSSLTSMLNASSIILDDEETDNAASLATKNTDNNIIYEIKSSVFQNSQLYNKNITERTDGDAFYGTYNDVALTMVETDFGWKTRILKFIKYNRMFKGLAMQFKMNKEIKSRVLILTKFSMTQIPRGFEKVELESAKFNKKYDIWVDTQSDKSQGQIEARYLLNTAFMERLMQIQTSFKVSKMCCSIYNDTMLIMLSTRKDLFEMNHLFGRIDDVNQYKHLFNEFASVLSFIDVLNLSSKTKL